MKKSELAAMFGLGDLPTTSQASVVTTIQSAQLSAAAAEPVGPNCLKLDKWSQRRGRDYLEANEKRLAALNAGEHDAADLLAAAYDVAPKLNKACTDTVRHEFVSQLLETEDYHAMHKLTMLDELGSEIAASKFAEQLAVLRAKRESKKQKSDLEKSVETIEAVSTAVKEATEEVEAVLETGAAFGVGDGSGSKRDVKRVAELYKQVRRDPKLRKIMDYAGRYRRLAQAKQRTKTIHGYDDMVGPDLGNDVGRLLPSELSMIGVGGSLEQDVLVRLVHKQAYVRDLRSLEGEARGPIIVAVDESGSMSCGDRIEMAKALALAMAWVARHQRRWCCLLAWSSKNERRPLILSPRDAGSWDDQTVIDWLSEFFAGGTEPPLADMPELWKKIGAPAGRTDILLLTDADCRIEEKVLQDFAAWKVVSKARLHTIVIGAGKPGDLGTISDELHLVGNLDISGEAISRAVSI